MKNFKKTLALLLAVLMVLSMAACGAKEAESSEPAATTEVKESETKPSASEEKTPEASTEKETLTMVMYTSTAVQEKVEAALVPFEEANNVDVEVILVALEDYIPKISTMIASGEAPDVFWVGENMNDQFYADGLLAELNDITTDPAWDWEDIAEGQRNHWTFGDKVCGIAFSGAPLACFYNKTLYEKTDLPTPTELYEKGEWTVDAMIEHACGWHCGSETLRRRCLERRRSF